MKKLLCLTALALVVVASTSEAFGWGYYRGSGYGRYSYGASPAYYGGGYSSGNYRGWGWNCGCRSNNNNCCFRYRGAVGARWRCCTRGRSGRRGGNICGGYTGCSCATASSQSHAGSYSSHSACTSCNNNGHQYAGESYATTANNGSAVESSYTVEDNYNNYSNNYYYTS